MENKKLSWLSPALDGAKTSITPRVPYVIIAGINSAGLLVYGAENVVDVVNQKMVDEYLAGASNADRLNTLVQINPEPSCVRTSKTILNGVYNEVLILEYEKNSVVTAKK